MDQEYSSVTGDCPDDFVELICKNQSMLDKNTEIIKTLHSDFDPELVLIQIQKDHQAYWVHALGEQPVAFGQLTQATEYAQG